jgi:hypothetical protein
MSSFRKVAAAIRDQRSLAEALTQMGYEGVQSHDQAVELTNAWGQGHGVSTAEVVIPAKAIQARHGGSHRSDVGFKKQADGTFALEVNDMDNSTFNAEWLARVKTHTGIASATRMAKRTYGCAKPRIVEKTVNGKSKTVVTFALS